MISGGDMGNEYGSPIHAHYLSCGAAAGVLGTPISEEEITRNAEGVAGRRQHFRGTLYGAAYAISLPIPADQVQVSCHRPGDSGTIVESTVTWSAQTGAHAVHGRIRDRWVELGGESGELGYPISDEIPTPDGRGRRSRFEHGEIWWLPGTGTVVHSAGSDSQPDATPMR